MSHTTIRRWVFWGVIAVSVVAMLVFALVPTPTLVDIRTVTREPLMVTLDHEGKTRAKDIFVISAPVSGHVLRIEHEPGDPVVAGETILATFVPTTSVMLDARTRAESAARVDSAASNLAQARADRERTRTEADFAVAEAERQRKLAANGVVSVTDLEFAIKTARAMGEALQAAEAAVNAAVHELEAASAAMLHPVDESSNGGSSVTLELRSPVDGVVLRRLRESSAVVQQGEALLEVADPGSIEIIADFLSRDAVQMRPGMPVMIERWGGETALKGRIRRIEPSGFMKISALGVEEQRVWVVIDIDDGSESWQGLGDGFRVETRVVVWQSGDALVVPTAALFRNGSGWAVFAFEGGRARIREVEIGKRNGIKSQVLEGLSEREEVVIHPPDSIDDGVRIAHR